MADQKMTYEDRVKAAAELYSNSYCSYVDSPDEHRGWEDFKYEGRKHVTAQAEAIRDALWEYLPQESLPSIEIDRYLLEHGYIEPNTEPKEGNEDE